MRLTFADRALLIKSFIFLIVENRGSPWRSLKRSPWVRRKTQLTGKLKICLWKPVQLQTTLDWQHIEAAGSRNFQHTPGSPARYRSVSTLVIEILPQDFPGFLTGTTAALRRPASAVGDSSCPPCSGWSGSCRLALWSLRWRAWTRPRCPACGHRRPRWSWAKDHCALNVTRKEFERFFTCQLFLRTTWEPLWSHNLCSWSASHQQGFLSMF